MIGKTPLENACIKVIGEDYREYYDLLVNLLLLNYKFIKENDPRLSAKITAILFDDEFMDKVNLICEFIENSELFPRYSSMEIASAKKLLDIDEGLLNTIRIIEELKHKLVDEKLGHVLRMNIRNDLEKYIITDRARLIRKY